MSTPPAQTTGTSPPKIGSSPRGQGSSPRGAANSPLAADVTQDGDVTTTVHPEIEAETYAESAYAPSELESYTTSLSSSIQDYHYENGRRYHSRSVAENSEYFLPNDEKENDRMDLNHHCMMILQKGALHAAPIGDNPQKIMDIGTGTGIWAIEMADKYPSAKVVGNDLSPIQPRWVPPNLSFEVDDIEKEWTHTPESFDFIYSRYMVGSVRDWPRLIEQAYKALKPGGYLEIMDPDSRLRSDDNTIPEDCALDHWNKLFVSAADGLIGSLIDAPNYIKYIQEAGYVEIQHEIFKLPNSPWPKDPHLKELGGYHMAQFMEGLSALSMMFIPQHKMTIEKIEVLLAKVRADMRNKSIHTYFNVHRYVARKPEQDA